MQQNIETLDRHSVVAVDLGSNSFHMIVARARSGDVLVLDRLREMVQLAAGLDSSRRLSRDAQLRALDCLRRFGQRVMYMAPERVRAVGTNTFRSAHDAQEFLVQAEAALGHPIETISGIEEARLIYQGVVHGLASPAGRKLVVDIGGGSTELIAGESFDAVRMESLYLGCVSMSRNYFNDGEITSRRWKRAELAAHQEFESVQARYRDFAWEEALGASGTVRAIQAVVRNAGWSRDGITPEALRRLRDAILKTGTTRKLRFNGLRSARLGVFPGGLVVLMAAFDSLGIEHMRSADGALREGLLYDLMGRIREEDVRGQTVDSLSERYHVDRPQAERIRTTALDFLEQTARGWELDYREARLMVSWAAQLHEIGLDIAHHHYHKHGEYIIAHSDLLGFSREEQKLLATLVRAHRRKFPVSVFKGLPAQQIHSAERLAILLRLSALLHRSRVSIPMPEPRLRAEEKRVTVEFSAGWLRRHPLTGADLDEETAYLRSGGYTLRCS